MGNLWLQRADTNSWQGGAYVFSGVSRAVNMGDIVWWGQVKGTNSIQLSCMTQKRLWGEGGASTGSWQDWSRFMSRKRTFQVRKWPSGTEDWDGKEQASSSWRFSRRWSGRAKSQRLVHVCKEVLSPGRPLAWRGWVYRMECILWGVRKRGLRRPRPGGQSGGSFVYLYQRWMSDQK